MKVAITGHTRGLGKILYDRYSQNGDTVCGFSLTNLYDLNDIETLRLAAHEMSTCDLVYNNAPGPFQVSLLNELLTRARGRKMVIINIGTVGSRFGSSKSGMYAAHKASMDILTASHQNHGERWPAALLIRPGYFTGDRSHHKKVNKVPVEYVADVAIDVAAKAFDDVYRINEITITK